MIGVGDINMKRHAWLKSLTQYRRLVSLGNNNYRVRHGVGKGFVNELAFELDLEG